jgi:hypothetical protein
MNLKLTLASNAWALAAIIFIIGRCSLDMQYDTTQTLVAFSDNLMEVDKDGWPKPSALNYAPDVPISYLANQTDDLEDNRPEVHIKNNTSPPNKQ